MKITTSFGTTIFTVLVLAGCATTEKSKSTPEKSYLAQPRSNIEHGADSPKETSLEARAAEFRFVPPMKLNTNEAKKADDVLKQFGGQPNVTVASNNLELKDYLHMVFGEKLAVSYVVDNEVNKDKRRITLNLQNQVSEKKLFTLTEELLIQRGYAVRFDDGIFYVHKKVKDGASANVVYGYGKQVNDIPLTSLNIIQLVPFEYGVQISLASTLKNLVGVRAIMDIPRKSLIIQGKRKEIVKALELIQIMDTPSMKNRQVGLYTTTFVQTDFISEKIVELMGQEGISVAIDGNLEKALSIVQLDKQGKLVLFANNQMIIERAIFWAKEIDKPLATNEMQYFIYHPNFARAVDMGGSLQALIGNSSGNNTGTNNTTSVASENKRTMQKGSQTSQVVGDSSMKMVIDERANAIIFHTSGERYQQILPLVKRLDILPKQVSLEVLIAEVTMTDEFKQGVEFALTKGNYGLTTTGAFMGDGFGGLSYLLKGDSGQLAINLLQTNSLVDVLSRPSIVVRDGVDANMSVGTDIPIIGETASDPLDPDGAKQTTKIEYRKTGIDLRVTPTVNSQGVVIMEITQTISNEVDAGSTVSGSPSIFERTVQTEVIAESGQTVMLGGLISENKRDQRSKVPVLGDIPFLGALFKADVVGGDKTELVIFVTPRVIDETSDWDNIKREFGQALTQLDVTEF